MRCFAVSGPKDAGSARCVSTAISLPKPHFPAFPATLPHTVAFWVKVPEDVQLSSAYAMVAWSANSKKLGSHPVHIGWNRNPTEGTIGVLRTDYGGGFALGATPLRDGRWHHVAVVFVPGEDEDTPVEVKQYVDGRFEGEGKPSPAGHGGCREIPRAKTPRPSRTPFGLAAASASTAPVGTVSAARWTSSASPTARLAPQQIVQLMKNNRPLQSDFAAVTK